MKYIIMCGGKYDMFQTPRHLLKVNGEVLVERTIRLLKENGIKDISISTDNPAFEYLNVPLLKHNNTYEAKEGKLYGYWCDAFYLTDVPTCYIFGDVYFSEKAIQKIINTETNDIEFFASMPPFDEDYPKNHVEPFALKVINTEHLKKAIETTKELERQNKFWRKPIMWELWTVIKNLPLQKGPDDFIYNYIAINDYTSDIDRIWDIPKLEKCILNYNYKKIGGNKMIKLECIKEFTLKEYNKLTNIKRKDREEVGRIFVGDIFECDKDMADYLTGKNKKNEVVAKVIKVLSEEVSEEVVQAVANAIVEEADEQGKEVKEIVEESKEEPKKKTTKRKTTNKKTTKKED